MKKEKDLTDSERVARARKIQNAESERKLLEVSKTPEAMRKILDEGKREAARMNEAVLSRVLVAATWTDARGILQNVTGPSISYPNVKEAPDLFVRSNRRSCENIRRAILRFDHTLDLLISVWHENAKALPEDLDGYIKKMIAEIPSMDTVMTEIIVEPQSDLGKTKSE